MLPRTTLVFTLSGTQVQQDLLHEFSLHDGVSVFADDIEGSAAIRVETTDSASAVWDVRATIGMFDDGATELKVHT